MLVVVAGTARADAPADLPLDQVTSLLREAGINSAWSITQWHSAKAVRTWGIEAYSAKHEATPGLCATQYIQIGVNERDGKLVVVEKSRPTKMYAFSGCQLSSVPEFHSINGPDDLATLQRLQNDLDTIGRALGGHDSDLKITFDDAESRKLFAPDIRTSDINSVESSYDGHSRFGFYTGGKDIIGAPEILCIEVVPGKVIELKADICAVIDIFPVKE